VPLVADRNFIPANILRLMSAESRALYQSVSPVNELPEEFSERCEAKAEEELARQVMGWLATQGVTAHRANPRKKSAITLGFPDLWFALPNGFACALELKMPGNKTSDDQNDCIAQMRKEGWWVAVVFSLAEAVAKVKEWRESNNSR
jgi:hypothetical protein